MVFSVESVSLFNIKTMLVDVRYLRLKVVIYESLYRAPLHREIDLFLCDNVWITQLVPDNAVLVFNIIVLDFTVLNYIPNDDRVYIARLPQNDNNYRWLTAASYVLDDRICVAVFDFKRDLMQVVIGELLVEVEKVDVLLVPLEKVL